MNASNYNSDYSQFFQRAPNLLTLDIEQIADADGAAIAINKSGDIIGVSLARHALAEVPEFIRPLKHLQVLRIFGNRISELPIWITELNDLTALYCGLNELTSAPEKIFELPRLEVLALNRNRIRYVPGSIAGAKALKILGLGINGLRSVPENIKLAPALRELHLNSNHLSDIPEWFSELSTLTRLTLAKNPVQFFPAPICKLKRLQHLDITETLITDVPPALFNLKSLVSLKFTGCPIKSLPKELGTLSALEELNITGTQLPDLPGEVQSLKSLRVLHAGGLRLTKLDKIAHLPQLEEVNLANSRILELPKQFDQARHLKIIDASGASLTKISPGLLRNPSISHLNLRGNKIRELPAAAIESSLSLRWKPERAGEPGIFLGGNPLESPPPEVINAGTKALRNYFAHLRDGLQPVDEVKIILVGEGGAGKTSLVRRMLGDGFDENESATHGIRISDHRIDIGGRHITGHFWDFGGQEIMHATHQFFLSKRSAYILVLDGRRDERTEYWLQHIISFGGDSPIIVVLNKADENPHFEVNRKFLKEKYKNIVGFHRCSCKTEDGVQDLWREISEMVARIESTKTSWPRRWFEVKDALEKMEADYIASDAYEQICGAIGLTAAEDQQTLLELLHDLGVVLHFSDLPLRDTNVINPRWITEGVYRLVNSPDLAASGGLLRLSALPEILDSRTHPRNKHNFIVEIMKKFELCYAIGSERVLLPALLPVEEPSFRFPTASVVHFIIDYDFLPKSIIPRFIVRMHDDIDSDIRWRTVTLPPSCPRS